LRPRRARLRLSPRSDWPSHVRCTPIRPLLLSALLATGAWAAQAQPGDNPLLRSPLPLHYPFDKLRDEHFAPALDQGMAEQLAEVQAIADNPPRPASTTPSSRWRRAAAC
jgi:peptidyl-dipeptidase Dcp